MNRYPSTEVSQWHEQKRLSYTIEVAEFAAVGTFEYYLDDFADHTSDNLVHVVSCQDPESGVEPIISVSSRIPEELRPYFALHEYIEFHISQIPSSTDVAPDACWEIEKFVLAQFTDLRQAQEYAVRRIEMFAYIDANFGGLSEAMQKTARYLCAYEQQAKEVARLRSESRQAYKMSQELRSDAMEAEAVLRSGEIDLPPTSAERSSAVIAAFLGDRPHTDARRTELEAEYQSNL